MTEQTEFGLYNGVEITPYTYTTTTITKDRCKICFHAAKFHIKNKCTYLLYNSKECNKCAGFNQLKKQQRNKYRWATSDT